MASVSRSPVCGIYKITNLISGMVYIGQSRDIRQRWAQHRCTSRNQHNYLLENAIKKYGIDNFSFDILEECEPSRLDEREIYYIRKYRSLKPNGYNLESGGNTNKEVTAESRAKMSAAWKTRPAITEKERRNRSVSHYKPVCQYTLAGVYIRTFQSIKEAASSLGVPEGNITNCCKGKNNPTAGGFMWRYASGGTENILPFINHHGKGHCKAVCQFDLHGNQVATYESIKEASSAAGVSSTCICECLKGKQKTAGGYVWRYAK